VVLGGSGNFDDFWSDKSLAFVATKNGLLGSQAEVKIFGQINNKNYDVSL
jgi:hypothetical protein